MQKEIEEEHTDMMVDGLEKQRDNDNDVHIEHPVDEWGLHYVIDYDVWKLFTALTGGGHVFSDAPSFSSLLVVRVVSSPPPANEPFSYIVFASTKCLTSRTQLRLFGRFRITDVCSPSKNKTDACDLVLKLPHRQSVTKAETK